MIDCNSFLYQSFEYIYRDKNCWMGYELKMDESVSPVCLQEALNSILKEHQYYSLAFESRLPEPSLILNNNTVLIYEGHNYPTDKNLVGVSYEGERIFTWFDHFLLDGKGGMSFTQLLISRYCELRYNVSSGYQLEVYDDSFPYEQLIESAPKGRNKRIQESKYTERKGISGGYQLRVSRADLIRNALEEGVKPFSYLYGLLLKTYALVTGDEKVSYLFPIDARKAVGLDDAPFNVVTSASGLLDSALFKNLIDFKAIDETIRNHLDSEIIRQSYVAHLKEMSKLHRLKASPGAKMQALEMVNRACGIYADVFFSYIGSLELCKNDSLREHIKDCWFVLDSNEECGIAVEAVGLPDSFNLTVKEQLNSPEFISTIKRVFAEAHIEIDLQQ